MRLGVAGHGREGRAGFVRVRHGGARTGTAGRLGMARAGSAGFVCYGFDRKRWFWVRWDSILSTGTTRNLLHLGDFAMRELRLSGSGRPRKLDLGAFLGADSMTITRSPAASLSELTSNVTFRKATA